MSTSCAQGIGEVIAALHRGDTEVKAPLLVHKKAHRDGSGEFACALGLAKGCPNVVNCKFLFKDSERRPYCLDDPETPHCGGLIAVEEKHQRLVEAGAPGAYSTLSEAIDYALNLQYN